MALSAEECPLIARVVVGSQAHGLARPDSDTDYREVFLEPNFTILGLPDRRPKDGWGSQGRHVEDEGGWELAKWLTMVRYGHPNAIELMFAPHVDVSEDPVERKYVLDEPTRMQAVWTEVRGMAQLMLSAPEVRRSYIGYAQNSFRKIEDRPEKWMVGYLRSLWQGVQLLTGRHINLAITGASPAEDLILKIVKEGELHLGAVYDEGQRLIQQMHNEPTLLPEKPLEGHVNRWLVEFRKDYGWLNQTAELVAPSAATE
jgi:hypothetical protein